MTPTECVALARYIRAHFPQQPLDEFTSEALHELLRDFPADDARTAVLNLAKRGEKWCPPSAVSAEVRRIRAERVRLVGDVAPPPGLSDAEERAWLRQARKQIGDGTWAGVDYGELVSRNIRELMAPADFGADQ